MSAVAINVTGRIIEEPRCGQGPSGTDWLRFIIAVPDPRWDRYGRFSVVAFGELARDALQRVSRNQRVTVRADWAKADAWVPKDQASGERPKAYGRVELHATDVITPEPEPEEFTAEEQANRSVIDGVTTDAAA